MTKESYIKPNFDARLEYIRLLGHYLEKIQHCVYLKDYNGMYILIKGYYATTRPWIRKDKLKDENGDHINLEDYFKETEKFLVYVGQKKSDLRVDEVLKLENKLLDLYSYLVESTKELLLPFSQPSEEFDIDEEFWKQSGLG